MELHNVVEGAKAHPLLVAGGVFTLGVLIILYYHSGTKSSTTSAPATTVSDSASVASIEAANALQLGQAQIAGQVQLAQIQAGASTSVASTNANAEVSIAQLAVTKDQNDNNNGLALAQVAAGVNEASIASAANVSLAGIAASDNANNRAFQENMESQQSNERIISTADYSAFLLGVNGNLSGSQVASITNNATNRKASQS